MGRRRQDALEWFVKQQICDPTSLWDMMMRNLKFCNWEDASNRSKLNGSTGDIQLKATNSLFSRMLIIAKSDM